jgi:hypothetical protein
VQLLYGFALPSSQALIEVNLLAAQIFIGAWQGPRALEAGQTALVQLRQGAGGYKEIDRTYLVAYSEALVAFCERWRDRSPAIRHAKFEWTSLNRVSGHVRRNFPLPTTGALDFNLEGVAARWSDSGMSGARTGHRLPSADLPKLRSRPVADM